MPYPYTESPPHFSFCLRRQQIFIVLSSAKVAVSRMDTSDSIGSLSLLLLSPRFGPCAVVIFGVSHDHQASRTSACRARERRHSIHKLPRPVNPLNDKQSGVGWRTRTGREATAGAKEWKSEIRDDCDSCQQRFLSEMHFPWLAHES